LSKTGSAIIVKREPSDIWMNAFNPAILNAWRANVDIQYIVDAYSAVMYVCSYVMKSEAKMSEVLSRVAKECRSETIQTQVKKLGDAFMSNREVSAQESAYKILSIPLKQLSRKVVFVSADARNTRPRLLKPLNEIEGLRDEEENIYCTSIHDRYAARPDELREMCLAEFAVNYEVKSSKKSEDSNVDSAANEGTQSFTEKDTCITLKDNLGVMRRRKSESILMFHRYSFEKEKDKYYHGKMMLFFPWVSEDDLLPQENQTYSDKYDKVRNTVQQNEAKFVTNDDNYDNAFHQLQQNGPPETAWDVLAPCAQEDNLSAEVEGVLVERNVEEEVINENADASTGDYAASQLQQYYKSEANRITMSNEEYKEKMRTLNHKQKQIVLFHRQWCKKAVLAMKRGEHCDPYRIFLSGSGGTGKSHVVSLIQRDTNYFFKLTNQMDLDKPIVLLTATTGTAAFNSNGLTVHAALQLGNNLQKMSADKLNTIQMMLQQVKLFIVDEVSTLGHSIMKTVNKRWGEIMGTGTEKPFGNVSVLFLGDLYQLNPVRQKAVYYNPPAARELSEIPDTLWRLFRFHELTEIERQKDDLIYAQLLNRIREAKYTEENICILKSREISVSASDTSYPKVGYKGGSWLTWVTGCKLIKCGGISP